MDSGCRQDRDKPTMKKQYFSTFQVFLMTFFAVLIVVAKIALRLPIQLSGHSGIFWMAIIIVGTRVVPKKGAATFIGLMSGIISAFMGLGDFGALNTLISYTAVGVGTDIALLVLRNQENLLNAALIGMVGHFGKFLVKWAFGVISGAPVGFVALGLGKALISYVVFGALGGILGGLTIIALKKAGYFAYLAEKK